MPDSLTYGSDAPRVSDYTYNPFVGSNKGWNRLANFVTDLVTGGQVSAMQNQQYQNDYNRWLAENYETPLAQRKQLESAGLNYNFAAQGQGASPSPSVHADVSNKALPQSLQGLGSALQVMNTMMGLASDGTALLASLQGIPKDLAYKEWRNRAQAQIADYYSSKADSARARAMFDSIFYGGESEIEPWIMNGRSWDPMNSPAMDQARYRNQLMDLKNQLSQYDLDNLKPKELEQLSARIRALGASAGLSEKTLDLFNVKAFGPLIVPLLLQFIKAL